MSEIMICICGLPATGKSTLLKALLNLGDFESLQFDTFLLTNQYQVARQLFYDYINNYKSNKILIIEHTFQHSSARKKVKVICEKLRKSIVFVVLISDLDVILERNSHRSDSVPNKSIMNIYQQWEDEPDAIIYCTQDKFTVQIAKEVLDIMHHKQQIFKPQPQIQTQVDSQKLMIDIESRKIVKEFILKYQLQKYGNQINNLRRQWLQMCEDIEKLEYYLNKNLDDIKK
ncbi:L-seryl-tRNA(Sec) kinase [Spironucleus salmonicida]|uniref:L-seryl-tRNA(Sec) kinase n=1 Tax=Spironucleus salmonicida TaxID=348837 RepID=V6LDP5_9EUKA|nr:L-seryl-tRNA(Sec) kinase [Spironucleus salmonicida]|eukprot:EST42607.1 L-seryl-tRNA(Sec) kinase [Spironucleus salmonicida]